MQQPADDTLARRLRRERELRGLGVEEAARALGVAAALLEAWEGDKTEPYATDLISLSRYYHCSPDYLLGLSNERAAGFVRG